jgi:deazaflavin-dependent oxidoreductase (nitroreductase family)
MVDDRPRGRRMNALDRALERVAASRAGGWYFIHVTSKVDPWLLKRTDGRWSTVLGQPVLLVMNRGARSGQVRETPLVFGVDGDAILLVASKGGSTKHPAWYHNLKAHPECDVIAKGRSGRYQARELEDDERTRAWEIVTDVYRGYDAYQARTGGRTIPVLRLERVG